MVRINVSIKDDDLKGLLCSALEGGSNYWYRNAEARLAEGLTMDDFREGGRMQDPKCYWHWAELVPFVEGCALLLEDMDGGRHVLDRAAMERGLAVMQEKFPQHLGHFLADGGDAITGDVFLQCSVFGDLIYG
jgi:hypothetical protein